MSFHITYKPLFEVKILHNYFLNLGTKEFNALNDKEKEVVLKDYNVSNFLEIVASRGTIKILNGHKLILKKHPRGFIIYCRVTDPDSNVPFTDLPINLSLSFLMRIKDPYFSNYTNISLKGKPLFYFGNSKPDSEGNNFELIAKKDESKLVSANYSLTADGIKNLKTELNEQSLNHLLGVIQLKIIGDSNDLSLLHQGKIKNPPQILRINFDNRKSKWRFKRSKDGSEIFTTTQANPLTKHGFIEITHDGEKFPNPDARHLIPDTNDFFSEIYI